MDSQNATATSIISEFESVFSKIMPDLAQLFEQYQVSGVLQTKLLPETSRGCTYINGIAICKKGFRLEIDRELLSFGETLTRDIDIVQKFWTDIESIFVEMVNGLSQSIQETYENFEVQFSIDASTVNLKRSVACQLDSNNILHCS